MDVREFLFQSYLRSNSDLDGDRICVLNLTDFNPTLGLILTQCAQGGKNRA